MTLYNEELFSHFKVQNMLRMNAYISTSFLMVFHACNNTSAAHYSCQHITFIMYCFSFVYNSKISIANPKNLQRTQSSWFYITIDFTQTAYTIKIKHIEYQGRGKSERKINDKNIIEIHFDNFQLKSNILCFMIYPWS